MRFLTFMLLFAGIFTNLIGQKAEAGKPLYLVIGSYTTRDNKDGIYVYKFNTKTGDAEFVSKVNGEENPSYVNFNRKGTVLYAVNETRNGNVSAYSFDKASGKLTFINKVPSGGDSPCFVETDKTDKFLFAANYSSGTLEAIPLNTDGSLGADVQVIKHEGSSVDKGRQSSPHVHSTFVTPDNKYILVPDLGTDKLHEYAIDYSKKSSPLTPADPAFFSVKPGSGPRHVAFSPDSKYVYLVHEMGAVVTAYDYNKGKLKEIQTISMLAPGFNGKSGGADIHVSADGKFLYASNRGDANDIAIYSIAKDGKLTYKGSQSSIGKMPRNFIIDPSGNYLLVANQATNDIIVFKRDKKTGMLTDTGKKIEVGRPVCLKFVD
jgi:6-phosphogluconolactonase